MDDNLLRDETFNEYILAVSKVLIRLLGALVGVLMAGLAFAVKLNVAASPVQIGLIIMHLSYTVLIALFVLFLGRFKSFRRLCVVISVFEIVALFIIVYMTHWYGGSEFTVLMLSVATLVVVTCLMPNRWLFKVVISIVGVIAFFVYSLNAIEGVPVQQVTIGSVFLLVIVLVCGLFALYLQKYQQSEFMTQRELMQVYKTDPLTKVGNRIMLKEQAEQWMEFCGRHHFDLSLVLVDIDDMKTINDERGHLVGDIVLREAALVMSNELRKNDVCVRWGGDEFVLLLPKTNMEQAKCLTRRIRDAFINQDIAPNLHITCSFGITTMKKGDSLDLLVQQADASMYAAKKQGKDKICANE